MKSNYDRSKNIIRETTEKFIFIIRVLTIRFV